MQPPFFGHPSRQRVSVSYPRATKIFRPRPTLRKGERIMEKFAKDRTEQIRTIPAAFGPLLFLGVLLIVRDRTGAEKTRLTLEAQDTIEIAEQTGAVKAPDKIKQQASTNKPANISKLVDVAPSGKFFVFAPGYEESSRSALLEVLLGKATKMSMKSIETLADLRA